MINTFDPDALIVGGGALETAKEFQRWFLDEIRAANVDDIAPREALDLIQSWQQQLAENPAAAKS